MCPASTLQAFWCCRQFGTFYNIGPVSLSFFSFPLSLLALFVILSPTKQTTSSSHQISLFFWIVFFHLIYTAKISIWFSLKLIKLTNHVYPTQFAQDCLPFDDLTFDDLNPLLQPLLRPGILGTTTPNGQSQDLPGES